MFLDKNKVADLILEAGLVSRQDFDLARAEADKKNTDVCGILTRQGKISEDEWRGAQMKAFDLPFADLRNRQIEQSVLTIIPEPVARQYGVVAFERDDKNLKVAILNLDDLDKIDFLKKKVGLRIIPQLTDNASISAVLLRYQELLKTEYGAMIQKEFLSFQTISSEFLRELSAEKLLELARDKKINFAFELFLKHALVQKVSAIHIEPRRDSVLIRYRIGGMLYPAMVLPKNAAVILALKIKALAGLKLRTQNEGLEEISQDGNFYLGFDGKGIDFQVHIISSVWGERIVLNVLREGDSGFSLETLGFHGQGLEVLHTALDKKEKLILIAGQKHSGRTTAFYTFLDLLKNPNLSVATMENSIGFQMVGVSQTTANPEVDWTVLKGIQQLAKQDIDIIAVDEADDFKAILSLFEIANRDKFVFSVLETNESSTAKIISKLGNAKISSEEISAGLGTVILQKLIPRLSDKNRQEYFLSVSEIKALSKKVDLEKVMTALVLEKVLEKKMPWSQVRFYKNNKKNGADGQDPNYPAGDGQGKIMVSEVLKISPLIKEMIMQNESADKIERQARKEGMLLLNEDMLFKAVRGLVSAKEIL